MPDDTRPAADAPERPPRSGERDRAESEAAVRAWVHETSRKARDDVNAALRRALADRLDRFPPTEEAAALKVLRPWAEKEANPEALAEWLGHGGWKAVDADQAEARLVKAARAAAAAEDPKDVRWFTGFNVGERELLCFDEPRAEDLRTLEEAHARVHQALQELAGLWGVKWGVEGRLLPGTTIRLGFDALQAALRAFEWYALSQLLPDPADKDSDWLGLLAGAWLKARHERVKREGRAVEIVLRPKALTEAGGYWTPMPRALDIASALGGPLSVDVNGEAYAHEPSLAPEAVGRALRPQGMDVVPAEWLGNPAQLSLALDLDTPPGAVREYLAETATRTATLAELPRMVPKLLGFMFAAAPMTKRPVKGTLLDLARWLYPEWATGEGPTVKPWKDRRQGPRDLKAIGAAFVAIKSLRLVETKPDGVRHPYDLFIVDYDLSAKPDAQVNFMLNPFLADRMKGGRGGGFFLLNMTRWLALGTKNPRLFALALRLAALWDGARDGGVFNPDRLRPIGADRLAYLCNTLPEGAAMYSTGRTKAHAAKVKLLNARANLEADLDALREAGLVGDWKPTMQRVHGKGWNLVPVPPEDYAEACKRAVNAAKAARKRGRKRGS